MGLNKGNEQGNTVYLHIAYGSLRVKTTKDDHEAKERETKDGKIIYERVYFGGLTGHFADLKYKEDDKYGDKWMLIFTDGYERFVVNLPIKDRMTLEFLKCLPNMETGKLYTIRPFDFEKNGKRHVGLSVKHGDEKIKDFYKKYTQNDDKSWTITPLYGYPSSKDIDFKDKLDREEYNTKVFAFLTRATKKFLEKMPRQDVAQSEVTHDYDGYEQDPDTEIPGMVDPNQEDDSLPF